MGEEKNEEAHIPGKHRTPAASHLEAAEKARAQAATWREIAEKALVDHAQREARFTKRSAELESQGALARGFLQARQAATAWDAAADKWQAGDRKQAEHFEEEANAATMESLDGLDKADELWEMEQESKSAAKARNKKP
ncbi:MAG: hypothetical protein OXU79_15400 [Gemmatimonadota bacterium]|nr:hypothetical protein [Gemmatimonadota bacterium]